MSKQAVVTRFEDGVAEIILNRPDRLNALNNAMRAELEDAVGNVEANETARVLVISGMGEKAFAAGADVGELVDLDAAASEVLSLSIMALHERLRMLPVPVIARIDGWCLGGGLELALACDIRIASDQSRFGFPEITLGIMPGGGGVARLVNLCGSGVARLMCLSGEIIDAEEALRVGLASKVVAGLEFEETAAKLVARLAGFSRPALAQIKSAIDLADHTDLTNAQRAEAKACALLFGTEDQRSKMQAFLAKKR